jgi:hypothetical protein
VFQRIITSLLGQPRQSASRQVGRRAGYLAFESLERRAMLTALPFAGEWDDDDWDDDDVEEQDFEEHDFEHEN